MPSYFLFFCLTMTAMIFMAELSMARQTYFHPDKALSSLRIEGRSNVNEFECISQTYSGSASVYSHDPPDLDENRFHGSIYLEVRIQVDGFECGSRRMNRDLQQALKSDRHPEIIFQYENAEILEVPATNDEPYRLFVMGTLMAAGETREIGFEAEGYYLEDSRMRATGQSEIRMTDFNIKPPTALLGLVQAEDELTVHFDLITSRQASAK